MTKRQSALFYDMCVSVVSVYLIILQDHDQISYVNGHSLFELYQKGLKWPVLVA